MLSDTGFYYSHSNKYVYKTITTTNVTNPNRNGSAKYKINYNLGDLDLGRMFKVSKRLNMRPHAGIRALWFTQKAEVTFSDAYVNRTGGLLMTKNQSTLVGLEGGVDMLWKLGSQFSIYANATMSSLVNPLKASFYSYNVSNSTPVPTEVRYFRNTRITNNLDVMLGLRWDKNFSNDNFHLGINLGYEQHSYWNMTYATNSSVSGFDGLGFSDTSFNLQGIALGMRFDF